MYNQILMALLLYSDERIQSLWWISSSRMMIRWLVRNGSVNTHGERLLTATETTVKPSRVNALRAARTVLTSVPQYLKYCQYNYKTNSPRHLE